MKRFIRTSLLGLVCIFMCSVAWFYGIKNEMEGNANFRRTNASPVVVTIPLGGQTYVDIEVDGINTVLEDTNQLTLWRFNDNRVVRTGNHKDGKSLSNGVMYMSNREVYKKYQDYYVSVSSDKRNVDVAKDSLITSQPYDVACPTMNEDNRLHTLPETTTPVDYHNEGEWKLPDGVEEIVLSQSSNDKSYHKGNWYFNYNFRYQKQDDAIVDAATRVVALSKQPLDWWYIDGDIFIAKSGNEIACVKQRNYTSCYFISSNDLAYIMLNL